MSLRTSLTLERRRRGLTQSALARTAGTSRAEISAIETGRLVPSTTTALRLARALGQDVESLFHLEDLAVEPAWAWTPKAPASRFWEALMGSRGLLFPTEPTLMGAQPHDGTLRDGVLRRHPSYDPERTLVVAGCDPAIALLASELGIRDGVRVVALTRGSGDALALLGRGLVHAAGIHWSHDTDRDQNAARVHSGLGPEFRLLHVARWEEGVALATSIKTRSATALKKRRLRWIAREEGSGARRCLEHLLDERRRFLRVASSHLAVAEAIRSGFGEAGVAVRLAAEEVGLDFVPLDNEDYDLCYRETSRDDPRIRALAAALARASLRRLLGDLPGYDVRRTGEERSVA